MNNDPISAAMDAEAKAIVAHLAMLDARDLANRAMGHAVFLRMQIGGPHAEAAAETFEERAAALRDLERSYAAAAGVSPD